MSSKRLKNWQEIADYLEVSVRTAQNFENTRGLPIHRIPGGGKPGAVAYTEELDQWLEGGTTGKPKPADALATEVIRRLQQAGLGADWKWETVCVRVPGRKKVRGCGIRDFEILDENNLQLNLARPQVIPGLGAISSVEYDRKKQQWSASKSRRRITLDVAII